MSDIEKKDLVQADYVAGLKLKEIAEKHDLKLNTLKSWIRRYGWCRGAPKKKSKVAEVEVKKSDSKINDKQLLFCAYYVKRFNATWAYQKVYEVDYPTAAVCACKLLKKANIQNEIENLKETKLMMASLTTEDIIQKYVDIAFSDIADFIKIENGKIELKDYDNAYAISEISMGTSMKIKMHDKVKALNSLMEIIGVKKEDVESKSLEKLLGELDGDKY